MKNTLKTMVTLTLLITALSACQQQKDVSTLLEKHDTRNEIFNTIISDHEYAEQLMTKMMEDDHTQMMMKGNEQMMGMMMSDNDQMMAMMKDKPDMMHNMMSNKEGMMDKETMMRNKKNMGVDIHPGHH